MHQETIVRHSNLYERKFNNIVNNKNSWMAYLGKYSVTIDRWGRLVTAPMNNTTFG